MTSTCDAYVICTSPRSGSTLLCDLLAGTGVAGRPASYFHRPDVAAWSKHLGLAVEPSTPERDVLVAVLRAAIAGGGDGGGPFGLRLQRASFPFLVSQLAILHPDRSTDIARFEAAFGRTAFVHLTRRDKVGQAVSHVKAEQTGLWHLGADGTERERQAPPRPPAYDVDAIRARLEALEAQDDDWRRWFDEERIAPLRVTYEELSSHPRATLAGILEHLGLDAGNVDGIEPGVAKMADRTNRDWAERFRADRAGA